MTSQHKSFVIAGAGQAGARVALTLRTEGFAGRIVLIGDEDMPPYERPPLSKGVLRGAQTEHDIHVANSDTLAAQGIEFHPNDPVSSIDRIGQTVSCVSGRAFAYERLFLATGGRARQLPTLPEGPRVFYLRRYQDALRLRAAVTTSSRVLVVGGGWIGLEVAALAREMGKSVTLVEAGKLLCSRSLPIDASQWLARLHNERGVTLHLGEAPSFSIEPRGVVAYLSSGKLIEADIAVVGIGMSVNDSLAIACGLPVQSGIIVDSQCRTDDPHVFAVGDVANHPNVYAARRLSLESWANAQNQAVVAAKAALGGLDEYRELPWFWSDQYDINIQIIGLPADLRDPVVRAYADDRETRFYYQGGKLRAAIAINSGRDIGSVRRWLLADASPERTALADPSVDLRKMPIGDRPEEIR